MKKLFEYRFNIFVITFVVIICISFILLQPKTASLVNSDRNDRQLETFIANIRINGKVDPKEFWQFREFYSRGNFQFERDGLSKEITDLTLSKMPVNGKLDPSAYVFLNYNSPKLVSLEALIATGSARSYAQILNVANSENLFENKNTMLLKSFDRLYLIFILPISEMKKANGFMDYGEKDKDLVKDKYWLSVSAISP